METSASTKECNNTIVNPLLKNKMEIQLEDKTIELSLVNLSKFFHKIYILCPFKNELIDEEINCKKIDKEKWNSFSSKLVLSETSIKLIKNFDHNHNLTVVNSKDFEMFNHFGFNLDEKILLLPILNISFLKLKDYLKIYEGNHTLEDVYNVLVINEFFSHNSKLNYNSLLQITSLIKNLEESKYWSRKYNCMLNISKMFNSRTFRLTKTRSLQNSVVDQAIKDIESDNIENNYLTMIFSNKNFVDASSAITKNGFKLYKIAKNSDINKDDINVLFGKLNETQKYYLFSNLIISKKYCHLVLNNFHILNTMSKTIDYFSDMYRYLIGYAWLRFYMEESIKKTWIKKEDELIFDINTASKLPVYPYCYDDPKLNPYLPIMVDNKYLNIGNNFDGVKLYNTNQCDYLNQGITNLEGFKRRMNLFISGNSQHDIFNNLEWDNIGMGISGSIMAACLQQRHPLMNLFKGKNHFNHVSDFDLDYLRYYNEYYPEADVDVMIKSSTPLEFIKKCKNVFNQVVVNICGFNPSNAEPHHVKFKTVRNIFLFVDEQFINENILPKGDFNLDYIVSNLKDEKVIKLFQPYFDKKIKDFYEENFDDLDKLKSIHPELFDQNETIYQVHMNRNGKNILDIKGPITISTNDFDKILEDDEIEEFSPDSEDEYKEFDDNLGINISFKVKISSTHIQRELELFSIFGDDFFSLVSKFHMPVVRSYYDGNNVYLTPSCISAHLTYMNLDYKYFAGSKDPIEIILKYRMRGFGTFLNRKEIDKAIKYIHKIPFWNNLYGIDPTNKQTIKESLGPLAYSHRIYHPRLFNMDMYGIDAPYVNINEGYNNVPEREQLTKKNVQNYIDNNLKYEVKKITTIGDIDLLNFYTISKDGYVNPVKSWIIESNYNIYKYGFLNYLSKDSDEMNKDIIEPQKDVGTLTPWIDSTGIPDQESNPSWVNMTSNLSQISSPIAFQEQQLIEES